MSERHGRYDPDERFSLHPLEGEEVLTHLLRDEDDEPDEDEMSEAEDS